MRNSKQQPSTPSSNAEVNLVILSMKGDTGALSKSIESLVQTFRGQNGYVLASAPATPRPPAAALSATSAVEEDAGLLDQQLTLDEIDTPAPPATTSKATVTQRACIARRRIHCQSARADASAYVPDDRPRPRTGRRSPVPGALRR